MNDNKKVHGAGTPPTAGVVPSRKTASDTGKKKIRLSELQAKKTGLICPECGCADLRDPIGPGWEVLKTVPVTGSIRRYRVCRNCGARVQTEERIKKVIRSGNDD